MTIKSDLAAAMLLIAEAKHHYESETGLAPNLLIIGANAYDGLGDSVYGMRVLVDDANKKDYSVGYVI